MAWPSLLGTLLGGAPAAVPTFLSLVGPSCCGLVVSGKVFCAPGEGSASPQPLSCSSPSAVPDSVPTRAHTSRQCLLIRVPVCPHSSFGHLAWQIGAHGKMGKEALRPGWQIGTGFLLLFIISGVFFLVKVLLAVSWLQLPFRKICPSGDLCLPEIALQILSPFGAAGHLKYLPAF